MGIGILYESMYAIRRTCLIDLAPESTTNYGYYALGYKGHTDCDKLILQMNMS